MFFLSNCVLNLHVVNDEVWFEKTIVNLNKFYKFVSSQDIRDYLITGKKINNACHITFDDGDVNFYNKAFPILKKYNIPSSIFVSPEVIRKKKNFWFQELSDYSDEKLKTIIEAKFRIKFPEKQSIKAYLKNMNILDIWDVIYQYQDRFKIQAKPFLNMNYDQIMELQDSNLVSIGAHTMRHPILNNESDDTVLYEIKESIKQLSELLSSQVTSFAFPNGKPYVDFSDRELSILKNNSINLSYTTERKKIKSNSNTLMIPRIGITSGSIITIIAKIILEDKWDKCRKIIKGKQEFEIRKTLTDV